MKISLLPLAGLYVCAGLAAQAMPPSLSLTITGPSEIAISADTMTCASQGQAGIDVTDMPLGAFRRADGTVLLLAGNSSGFTFQGASVETAKRVGCAPILTSQRNPDPSQFSDKEWLLALHSLDGVTIWGFLHEEFHGETHGDKGCVINPAPERTCWYSAVTYVKSTDGGQTFTRPAAPANLILSLPFRYQPNQPRGGVALPKLIRSGDWLYMLATYSDRAVDGAGGQCLLRAPANKPEQWEVWTGSGFDPVPGSPYVVAERPGQAPCTPVVRPNVMSLKYDPVSKTYVVLAIDRDSVGYMTSADLIHWSDSQDLVRFADLVPQPEKALPQYFSMLDPQSTSPSFDTVGGQFYVYYVVPRVSGGKVQTDQRDVFRFPVSLAAN